MAMDAPAKSAPRATRTAVGVRGGEPARRREKNAPLDLAAFIPYRLAVLADAVSHTIAQLYVDRFGMSRQEWRILAWLGKHRTMQSKEVGRSAGLDKMQLSRAVAQLTKKKLVAVARDAGDRRGHVLTLTPQGRAVYDKIVPLALAREHYLLSALTAEEVAQLDVIMEKLLRQAIGLKSRG